MDLDNSLKKLLVSFPESILMNNFKFRAETFMKISEFDSVDKESKKKKKKTT